MKIKNIDQNNNINNNLLNYKIEQEKQTKEMELLYKQQIEMIKQDTLNLIQEKNIEKQNILNMKEHLLKMNEKFEQEIQILKSQENKKFNIEEIKLQIPNSNQISSSSLSSSSPPSLPKSPPPSLIERKKTIAMIEEEKKKKKRRRR